MRLLQIPQVSTHEFKAESDVYSHIVVENVIREFEPLF